MMRLVAAVLLLALATFPVVVLPSRIVAWLSVPGVVVGVVGVVVLSVPIVTAGAVLLLGAYALILTVVAVPADVVSGVGFGAVAFLLLEVVDLAGRTRGATLGRHVMASQARRGLIVVGAAALGTLALAAGGVALRLAVGGSTYPVVVIVGALGALAAAAGMVALVMPREPRAGPPTAREMPADSPPTVLG